MKFRLLKESLGYKTVAFMINKKGECFPVIMHINFAYWDDSENVFQWLYNHTDDTNIKNLIMSYFKSWALLGSPKCRKNSLIDDLCKYIEDSYNNSDLIQFIQKHATEIENSKIISPQECCIILGKYVKDNFLKMRYGGLYDSWRGSKELTFRVSSKGFNWFPIIWELVHKHRKEIDSVTITNDDYDHTIVYKINGQEIEEMPVDEFLTLPGNPIIEELI